MSTDQDKEDPPLPATVGFVIGLGILLVAGWLAMYFLMLSRR
jgi:hypothetical protein